MSGADNAAYDQPARAPQPRNSINKIAAWAMKLQTSARRTNSRNDPNANTLKYPTASAGYSAPKSRYGVPCWVAIAK
jgi:hypothetical protein